MLISSEMAEVESVGSARRPDGHWGPVPPQTGALVITDRRIYVATFGLVFREFDILFEAISEAEYAKQRIETVKARNDEIREEAKSVSLF